VRQISPAGIQRRGSGTVIYKITEIVDGQEHTRYSDQKPTGGIYQAMR